MEDAQVDTLEELEAVRAGEPRAVDRLSARCSKRMAALARPLIRRLGLRAEIGSDDVANRALLSVYEGARSGKLPRFESKEDFWRFVGCLMARLCLKTRDACRARKRGGPGRNASGDSARSGGGFRRVEFDSAGIPCLRPSAEETVLGSAEVEAYLESLDREGLREIVRMLEEGYTLQEIADAHGWSVWTVKRRIHRARELWNEWERRR
ncbi:MAG: RNA polymerase sigma factor [Isosphaeraceae bacterium]